MISVLRCFTPPAVTVAPGMPILYFGDLHANQNSKLRIVTVAANPSSAEFPAHDPLLRFSAWRPFAGQPLLPAAVTAYQVALASYFQPPTAYWRWFSHLSRF